MIVFSYVVEHDFGLAPNPFYGLCTLACCKPVIRKTAGIGDLIIGTSSCANGRSPKLLYMMKITEISDFTSYWNAPRFECKKPNLRGSTKQLCGDNIYHHDGNSWQQADSLHTNLDGSVHRKHLKRDTEKTTNVLISNEFVYFGRDSIPIPPCLEFVIKEGKGHKCRFSEEEVALVNTWFNKLPRGIEAFPHDWNQLKKSCS